MLAVGGVGLQSCVLLVVMGCVLLCLAVLGCECVFFFWWCLVIHPSAGGAWLYFLLWAAVLVRALIFRWCWVALCLRWWCWVALIDLGGASVVFWWCCIVLRVATGGVGLYCFVGGGVGL